MTESAIAAPPQLDTFRVVYRAGVQRPDDSDTGSEPNWFAQGGSVTISCSAEKLVVTEADGRRRVVVSAPGATLSKQQTTDLTAALMAVPSLTEARPRWTPSCSRSVESRDTLDALAQPSDDSPDA